MHLIQGASAPPVRTSLPRSTGLELPCTSKTAAKALAVRLMRIGTERSGLDGENTKADDGRGHTELNSPPGVPSVKSNDYPELPVWINSGIVRSSSVVAPTSDPKEGYIGILGDQLARRLSVRHMRKIRIRVSRIFDFHQPWLNYRQLSHARASRKVWDSVTPHQSARKCEWEAPNLSPT